VAYRRRNVIERCVGRLEEDRRLATRYEKLAIGYLALVHVAMIGDWLRRLAALSDTP
jgi:transposase